MRDDDDWGLSPLSGTIGSLYDMGYRAPAQKAPQTGADRFRPFRQAETEAEAAAPPRPSAPRRHAQEQMMPQSAGVAKTPPAGWRRTIRSPWSSVGLRDWTLATVGRDEHDMTIEARPHHQASPAKNLKQVTRISRRQLAAALTNRQTQVCRGGPR
jgi:hypothetical protein